MSRTIRSLLSRLPPSASRLPSHGLLIVGVFALAACAAPPRPPAPPPGGEPAALITADVLAAPIRFLADDALAGRAPGTEGDYLSRLYISTTMQLIGLRPGAGGGTWEQPFELVGITSLAPDQWTFRRDGRSLALENRSDFVAVSGVDQPQAALDGAEVVFVGYGIQAPEYQWDDFKGADLRGKVLLMLNNDPDWDPDLFAGKRRLYYGRWTYKYESAARQGAVGAIVIHTTESAGYPWQTVQTSWGGENSRLPGSTGRELQVHAWITADAAARLVSLAGMDLTALVEQARRRDFEPVALGISTSLRLTTHRRSYETANVVGVIVGSDPVLRAQTIVYTAHHDHLGMRSDGGPDRIYNGALDNASGVAEILAVARAFASLPQAPRRSLLFVAVAAEEQGLLGSAYYVAHPTVAPAQMVANLNFDGANIWGRTTDVVAVGYGKTTLDRVVASAAASQGRVLVDEPFPERGHFYRSDQFNFAKIGVPAVLLESGVTFVGRPEGWGREQVDAWTLQHYHQPSDELTPDWNFDGMVEDARLAFWVGFALAESSDMPAWLPGDEFEAVRKRALGASGS